MKLTFHIEDGGEYGAGILPFTDEVEITIVSGDPGGEPGDFQEFMRQALLEWYDGAGVETEQEFKERINDENKYWQDTKEN
jgi:hypothetical protein